MHSNMFVTAFLCAYIHHDKKHVRCCASIHFHKRKNRLVQSKRERLGKTKISSHISGNHSILCELARIHKRVGKERDSRKDKTEESKPPNIEIHNSSPIYSNSRYICVTCLFIDQFLYKLLRFPITMRVAITKHSWTLRLLFIHWRRQLVVGMLKLNKQPYGIDL